ncbi:MAG: protein kinase domain-containing protein, partial [Gemmatimonadales bacterium]
MTDTPRLAAALGDRYTIDRELGAGGMATVYLAHDIRHDRRVAVKVLRPELAAVIGAERFLAEIRTTANLQHPHILPLFDSGEADSFLFYVMPYVEGISLRDRVTREKQLPISEAVRIATEVAGALDYAHRHGVIHRDIKPENIMLHDGSALVADFGIALAASKVGTRMTETGMSLGTPQYMSPEQAMGERELDARSDQYALGCVTYEMLTGEPPFTGPTAQAIVAKVMTAEPAAVTSLRRTVPVHVANAIHTALQKLPADRFATIAAFADALASSSPTHHPVLSAGATTSWLQRQALPVIATLGVIAATAVGFAIRKPHAIDTADANRFDLAFDANETLATGGVRLAWSPDGRSFVYSGTGPGGTSQLLLRSLDSLTPMPLAGTAGASSPFFSPDGESIGYVTTTPFSLRVVPRTGGTSRRVVAGDSISGGGGDWGDDGYIYFDGATALSRIRPDGTGRQVIAALDTLRHEVGLAWPQVLPHGRGVIFRVRRTDDDVGQYSIEVANGTTHARKRLVTATMARYAPGGYLLYVLADGTLMASRFDLEKLTLSGTPVVIARNLDIGAFGAADLSLSSDGSLLYATGSGLRGVEPVWVARDGATSQVDPAWTNVRAGVALSPDGTRLAVGVN